MIKLFIAGLPESMDEIGLVEMFSVHGHVDTVKIIRDRTTHKSLGYGFLELTERLGAERAIKALNGINLGASKLSVRHAEQGQIASHAQRFAKRPVQTKR